MTSDDVKMLQSRLAALDLYHGKIDGLFGPMTRTAVETFQLANGLDADGIVGPKTRAALFPPVNASRINQAGLNLIMEFEGCLLEAYRDSVNVLTIGYGHTSVAGPPEVKTGMKIARAEAEAILQRDLGKFEKAVLDLLTRVPTPNQFAAMVSLCFNIGPHNFTESSVLRHFNAGDMASAADAFLKWNRAGGKILSGLIRRRQAERALFLKP